MSKWTGHRSNGSSTLEYAFETWRLCVWVLSRQLTRVRSDIGDAPAPGTSHSRIVQSGTVLRSGRANSSFSFRPIPRRGPCREVQLYTQRPRGRQHNDLASVRGCLASARRESRARAHGVKTISLKQLADGRKASHKNSGPPPLFSNVVDSGSLSGIG